MSSKRNRQLDMQLFDDPAILAALEARKAQTRGPVLELKPATRLPWGSAFKIAVDCTDGGTRHASSDRSRTECDRSCSSLVIADGMVGPDVMIGPGGAWLKPSCPSCLQVVNAWENAHP